MIKVSKKGLFKLKVVLSLYTDFTFCKVGMGKRKKERFGERE
jgi:hypothetical protein